MYRTNRSDDYGLEDDHDLDSMYDLDGNKIPEEEKCLYQREKDKLKMEIALAKEKAHEEHLQLKYGGDMF